MCLFSTRRTHFVGNPVKFLGVLCNQLTNFQGFFLLYYVLILSLTIVLIGADLHYVALAGLQFFS